MAEYAKLNDVSAADIVKINGVPYASVAKCSGLSSPSSGASRWVCVNGGGYVVHAANSDRTSWTSYDNTNSTPQQIAVAFGKNSSGAGLYVAVTTSHQREIMVSGTDVTSGIWTDVNISPNKDQYGVAWGAKSDGATAGVWMTVGDSGTVYRSTDGASSFSKVSMSSTNLGSKDLWDIASNGSGKWAFGAEEYLYVSTDDGATFSESEPWSTNEPGKVKGIVHTNSSWVIAYRRGSAVHFRSCSDSDMTDWSDEFSVNATNFPWRSSNGLSGGEEYEAVFHDPSGQLDFIRMAAFNGKVCAISTNCEVILSFNVNGKTMSGGAFRDGNASVETGLDTDGDLFADICTDGVTWLASCRGGDVFESTDNGDTWTQVLNDHSDDGVQNHLNGITCDVVLPL